MNEKKLTDEEKRAAALAYLGDKWVCAKPLRFNQPAVQEGSPLWKQLTKLSRSAS
jgi:hypothetical protein